MIVHWRPQADSIARRQARAKADVTFERTIGDRDFQVVEVGTETSVGQAVRALRRDPRVESAARSGFARLQAVPNDPGFPLLWGLNNTGTAVGDFDGDPLVGADIGALSAWERRTADASVVVAVIDSGHAPEHPDLAGVGNVGGYDFVGSDADSPVPDPDPTDDDVLGGHGVHVAGTILAEGNNSVGVVGVAHGARLMPLRVCAYSSAAADVVCPYESIIAAILHARNQGARIANMSLGGSQFSQPMLDALAESPEVLFVVAAGNRGADNDVDPSYPCAYPIQNVVCVAATDQADQLAQFTSTAPGSSFGLESVDLGAPGDEIVSTYPFYPWELAFGDDFTAPDFDDRWDHAPDGGFSRSNEPPLAPSWGITDSPGGPPGVSTVRESTSVPVALPAGYSDCVLFQWLDLRPGDTGEYRYSVLLDGAEIDAQLIDYELQDDLPRLINAPQLSAGGEVSVRVRYSAGAAPGAGDGVWVDDFELFCVDRDAVDLGYAYLDGTSMAAPHVAGAAALAFSLAPSATVSEIRAALLAGADPVPALAGKTVTGGRLDAARTLALLAADGPAPAPTPPPAPPLAVPDPVAVEAPRADPSARRCRVPRLRGLRLRKARRTLVRANCRLGKVRRVERARGKPIRALVVRGSRPRAGVRRKVGSRVAVTLKVKPRRHARRR